MRRTAIDLQKKFDEAVVKFITHTSVPLQVVEEKSFEELLDLLGLKQKKLELMSRRTLGRRLDEASAKYRIYLTDLLSKPAWVSTTADIWSGGKRSFLGMTVHWIDGQYNRRSAPLVCKRFRGTHSFERIADLVSEIHESYNLPPSKISATVTDNGSNFIKAFTEFGILAVNVGRDRDEVGENAEDGDVSMDTTDESMASGGEREVERDREHLEVRHDNIEDEESEEYASSGGTTDNIESYASDDDSSGSRHTETNSWVGLEESTLVRLPSHARCASHTLSLCATTDVKRVLENHRALADRHDMIITKCNSLWNASRTPKWAEVIQAITGRALPRPVVTRWNSLFDSLTALLEQRPKIPTLMARLDLPNPFTDEDFSYIKEYLECLKPIAIGLDKLQAEKLAFYGVLLPTLHVVRKQLFTVSRTHLRFCGPVVEGLLQSMETRFEKIFNCRTIEGEKSAIAAISMPTFKKAWFACIAPEDREFILDSFRKLMRDRQEGQTIPEHQPMTRDNHYDYYDFGDEHTTASSPASQRRDAAQEIMQQYLDDADTALVMLEKYPTIASIFREFNTQPPSSAEVERLFSYATMTNAPNANRLSDTRFEQRVILRRAQSVFD
ncbi:uncharacterized protein LOC108863814 [Galendromus occidentalis]|uniref:Uncharacterized protein LOC108863814 n=1 Tax=Galendromus occidentalis TaxID=34638 RepID=A0AAJ7L4A8_9ACAR|nr:uncharacterized protein LOC108863814 [Galendromus occidentalis]